MAAEEPYRETMRERYRSGEMPWDTGVPEPELIHAVEEGRLPGATALELGCGTGMNAIEMARRGYRVTAIDPIDLLVRPTRTKSRGAGVAVDFVVW